VSQERLGKYVLKISDDNNEVAYLYLPTYPGPEAQTEGEEVMAKKSIRLTDVIGAYDGPDIVLDFDENNILVGVEFF